MTDTTTWMIAQAIFTAVAVLVAVLAIISQRSIQHQQQKQDLFDKRYAIYQALRDLSLSLTRCDTTISVADFGGHISEHLQATNMLEKFETSSAPINFFFGPEIERFVYLTIRNARTYLRYLNHRPQPQNEKDYQATLNWIRTDAWEQINTLFHPYLDLNERSFKLRRIQLQNKIASQAKLWEEKM